MNRKLLVLDFGRYSRSKLSFSVTRLWLVNFSFFHSCLEFHLGEQGNLLSALFYSLKYQYFLSNISGIKHKNAKGKVYRFSYCTKKGDHIWPYGYSVPPLVLYLSLLIQVSLMLSKHFCCAHSVLLG